MVHINIDRLTEGILTHTIHMCINRLWNVCKQIDYTYSCTQLACAAATHSGAPWCSQWMMDGVRVRTGDTREHPFISVTQLIPLSSHPLRHSASRQTPPPKPHPTLCVSRLLFPFSFCLFSSMRSISFTVLPPNSPLFGSYLKKNK